jgi:hypothetical protein
MVETQTFMKSASAATFTLLAFFIGLTPGHAQTLSAWQPLDAGERWTNFWDTTLADPNFYSAALLSAGYSQITKDPPEWQQGAAGLGRRTASWLAVYGIREIIHQGGAAILDYHPRYLSCGCSGFFPRTGHAIKWTFLTKNTSGQTRLDLPVIAGTYGANMLSTYWYPARYQALSDGVRNGNQQMALSIGLNFLLEFEPDLKRMFKH